MPLTVGATLLPKRAYSLTVGGRLLTMRTISSPPFVEPRLGFTRDSTGSSSSTCSLIGTDTREGPYSSMVRGLDANAPNRVIGDENKDCACAES